MKRMSILMGAWCAVTVGTTAMAQSPVSDVDTHIAIAKAAAGQDYRATFVNLCLPAAPPGGSRAADAGSIELVRVSLQTLGLDPREIVHFRAR